MNYDLILYLLTSAILGVSLGIEIYKGKSKLDILISLIWLIAYILIIATFN